MTTLEHRCATCRWIIKRPASAAMGTCDIPVEKLPPWVRVVMGTDARMVGMAEGADCPVWEARAHD